MIISEKEEWNEFLNWIEENRDDLPEWFDKDLSMHECMLLWKERIKNDNQ